MTLDDSTAPARTIDPAVIGSEAALGLRHRPILHIVQKAGTPVATPRTNVISQQRAWSKPAGSIGMRQSNKRAFAETSR
ncbi:MAG: hypothetical protein M3R41_04105 [Pseudomonadota bacterium]|nr:hypothetical protein [Pseudomonadota bacterium]